MNIIEKIKVYFAVNDAYKKIKEAYMKGKGFLTSEFWLTALGVLASLAGALVGYIPPELTIKIVAGLTAVYTIARAIVKLTPSTKDDELVEKIAQIIKNLGGKPPEIK